jgi:hypothetical protein
MEVAASIIRLELTEGMKIDKNKALEIKALINYNDSNI